ncbi:hydroxymethylglutaryl-CoA lyase [Micromonospora sp. ATA51]|uniref:hydroxymethylglutaryl-CoA lyase n=1 Tax=Micromonospora sp. ATA51 TaxID=2806098 RepID=UPI001A541BED|nr:hydroxymethylglutaryl-CoA lyase [Micromonospora sp. ATA51]MBM0224423.1 hydroxymethylglutaryl-CoA lyase [Micromonospora sp. ATA51]
MGETADSVVITEVVLRDGLQNEATVVRTADKARLATGLVEAGLTSLEVGAFVNPVRVPQMADTDELLRTLGAGLPARLHTLVFNTRGAERAAAAGARHVRFVVSASEGHSRSNTGVGVAESLDRIERCTEILAAAGISLEASIATAFVCPFDGDTPVEQVTRIAARLVGLGAQVIHLADTIGAGSPGQVRRAVSAVQDQHPATPVGLHLHNTYGMAAANAWEAIRLGVRRFDASLGGLGGCPFAPGASGNVGTDDLVHLFHREGINSGIDEARLHELREELAVLVGHRLASALAAVPSASSRLRPQ